MGDSAENDAPCPRCGRTWRGLHAQWCEDAATAENGLPNLRLDPQAEAIRTVLREADDTWMPSQSRDLFERLWDIVGGRVLPSGGTDPNNPIIHRPGCSWETTPYCNCGADRERLAPGGQHV